MKTIHCIFPVIVGLSLTLRLCGEAAQAQAPAALSPVEIKFEQAIDRLFAENFPQKLETYFCSLGSNPDLGFRLAGSEAEHATSERVAAEMRAMGLKNVRLEPVPVDAYEFKHASVAVGERMMVASTLDGARPAPAGGIAATLVYVKSGTAADYEAVGDVTGKLVLVDKRMSSWWFTAPGLEAARRGAVGVICTAIPEDPLFYSINDQALGGFASYDPEALPWVYVAQRDGDWLKAQLAAGPITAKLLLDATITPMEKGGTGYNVIGELPGSSNDGQLLVFVAHQDAHFRAGLDDTGALVNMLTVAKAMTATGDQPRHTIVFLATTGEEYGRRGSYYDWSIGAWWAATHSHTDWAGRVRLLVNLEYMAFTGAPLGVNCDPTLKPAMERIFAQRADLQPSGKFIRPRPNTWTDQWTFSAAGIPTINVITNNREHFNKVYHTNFETADLVDWPYLAKIAKFIFTIACRFDDGFLPFSVAAQCDEILTRTPPEKMTAVGAETVVVARWNEAVERLRSVGSVFDTSIREMQPDQSSRVNRRLLEIEKLLNHELAAFASRFEERTVFPHEQLFMDLTSVKDALAALRAEPSKSDDALKVLTKSSLTRIGLAFSAPVYERELAKRTPGFARLHWGEQGQLTKPLDLVPACRKIQEGDFSGAIAELESRRTDLLAELNDRLSRMTATLEQATTLLQAPLP